MVDTSPPIWYLDIVLPDNKAARISLSTEELQNPRLFQRRCMETIQQMPPTMKMDQWEPIIAALMKHCAKIEIPPEMSPAGQFREYLEEFLTARPSTASMEDMLRGLPFKNATHYHFRLKDLLGFLTNQRFSGLRQHEMFAILKNDLKAEKRHTTIAGKTVRYFQLPHHDDNAEQPLKPAEFQSGF